MPITNGSFIVSLDCELMWGVRDVVTKEQYGEHILGAHSALPKMLKMFSRYNVNASFAVVGFLFCKTKHEILQTLPSLQPGYTDRNLSPYGDYIQNFVGLNEEEDPYNFAPSLLQAVSSTPGQEIATHTYSHYYTREAGQTLEEFTADLKAALAVARKNGIEIRSIIFPRNQVNRHYLAACRELGITSYRGTEKCWMYNSRNPADGHIFRRMGRLSDSYINLTGHHCQTYESMAITQPYNIASARFLRPYSKKLRMFEGLRLKRITDSMTHAAQTNTAYHLWWHPHNFGINQDENFEFLQKVLEHFRHLSQQYNFQSITMRDLADKLAANYPAPELRS